MAGKYNLTVTEITKKFKADQFLLQPHPGDLGFGHPDLCTALRECISANEFMTIVYDICKQDLNDFVYIMQHFCRVMCSYERLCECLYLYGPSKTGKDVICQLIENFFGDDFTGGVPSSFFLKSPGAKRRASEGCSPYEASLAGKKAIIVPDMKKGDLDMDVIKPMCEQAGAKTTSRGCGQNPVRTNPSYEIFFFSNFAPNIPVANQESGGLRRLNVYYMRNRFMPRPDDDEQVSKPTIKERAKAGEFAVEFFHVCKVWYEALACYDTNIWAPPYVKEATAEALQEDADGTEIDSHTVWINDTFEFCRVVEASTSAEIKTAYRTKYGRVLKDASIKLRELGFTLDIPEGTKRICKYSFDGGRKVPIKLKRA